MNHTQTSPTGNNDPLREHHAESRRSAPRQARLWRPLFVFILFSIAVTAISNSILRHYKESIKKDKQNELGAIAELKIGQITTWIEERKGDAQALKNDPLFLGEVERWLQQGGPTGETKLKLAARLTSLQQAYAAYGYTSVSLFDDKAVLRLSSSANEGQIQGREKERMLENMRTGQTTFSDIHREKLRVGEVIEIDLVTPLLVGKNGKMRPVGAIFFRIDPQRFLFPLIQRWPTLSTSAESLLIRRDGNNVLFLNELRHRSNTALSLRFPLSQPELLGAMAVMGQEGLVEGLDHRGAPVVGVLNKVAGTSWYMVNKIDKAEIYAPINQLSNWVMALILGLVGVGGSVTIYWREKEKKRYESELARQSLAKHLDYLSKYANDIIMLLDKDGKIVSFNDRALETYGYPAEDFSILNISDLQAIDFLPSVAERLREIDRLGALRFEAMHARKKGENFPIEASVRLVEIRGEKFYQAIIRDITERKNAETGLHKLNRALRLLSSCNAALAHAEEERQLLTNICRLIVENGGYRMAWVGFAEHDPERSVRTVAHSGFDDGYLDSANISWAETERGHGPVGIAIRTGVTQINQNFLSNPLLLPWREAALARGFQSSIAIPFRCEGDTCGILTIYSAETAAFNAEEVELLEELTHNMAYGIATLRVRAERTQAMEKLRQSEELFRFLTENATDMAFLMSIPSGRYEYISPASARLFGHTPEEFYRSPMLMRTITHPAWHAYLDEKWEKLLSGDVSPACEYQIIHKSGETRWVSQRNVPIWGEPGSNTPIAIQGVVSDITDRKQAEIALRSSEMRFSTVFSSSPIGIAISQLDNGQIIDANESFQKIYGYTLEQLKGHSSLELNIWPDLEEWNKVVAILHEQGSAKNIETKFRHNSGKIGDILGSFELIELNGQHYVLGMLIDITERKNAEKKLREQRSFMWQIIDADPNHIFVKDANGEFLLANQSLATAYGLTTSDVVGKRQVELNHSPDEVARLMETDRKVIRDGRDISLIESLTYPDGEQHWFLTIKKRLAMPDGKLAVLGIATDITQQKLSEIKLAESYRELQRLSLHLENIRADERARIALDLHDEMGATLVAIKMGVAWLASRLPANEPQLGAEVARLIELVSGGINTLHRITSQLRPNLLNDTGLVAAIIDYVKKFRQQTRIECVLDLPIEELTLGGDQSITIFRILQESLNNVAKHAQASGVNIILAEQGEFLLLEVTDNGIGFDTTKRREQSLGLLGIRERALMLGGNASIRSTPGHGSCVSVSIPYSTRLDYVDCDDA